MQVAAAQTQVEQLQKRQSALGDDVGFARKASDEGTLAYGTDRGSHASST